MIMLCTLVTFFNNSILKRTLQPRHGVPCGLLPQAAGKELAFAVQPKAKGCQQRKRMMAGVESALFQLSPPLDQKLAK